MKVYVVNYRETTIDSDNVMNTDSGVCEFGYTNKEDALTKVYELCDEKMNEFSDDIDDEMEKIENGEMDEDDSQCFHESNRNRDWQLVKHFSDTYEYFVEIVDVKE